MKGKVIDGGSLLNLFKQFCDRSLFETFISETTYFGENDIERVDFPIEAIVRYRLAKTQESTAEEPIGEINLHEYVDEVENLAESQVIRPRPVQMDTVQESVPHLKYFLVAIIL